MKNSVQYLDYLLGEAVERIVKATDSIQKIDKIDPKKNMMALGRVIAGIWDVRNELYHYYPEVKADFIKESEQHEDRYKMLNDLAKKAITKESGGDVESAKDLFQELYNVSKIGHFRLIAEAGLFRVGQCN